MHRGKHAFDICAAPFGTGFFVSWWFTEPPLAFAILYTLGFLFGLMIAMDIAFGIGFAIGLAMQGYAFGMLLGGSAALLGAPALLWIWGNAIRHGSLPGESTVLAMPLIGWVYERILRPQPITHGYRAHVSDSVHRGSVVDCMTEGRAFAPLQKLNAKPFSRSLRLPPEILRMSRIAFGRVTRQFYEWERRGRGWTVWERPSPWSRVPSILRSLVQDRRSRDR
jgi:hypothetical protein